MMYTIIYYILREAVRLDADTMIALKLDVEGGESWMLEGLLQRPKLLCATSYRLFVEFHHLPGKRLNLTADTDCPRININMRHCGSGYMLGWKSCRVGWWCPGAICGAPVGTP